MACNNIREIVKDCFSNTGGITELYLIDQDEIASLSIVDNVVVDLTTLGEAFIKFDIARNTGNYTEVDTVDVINGSTYVIQTINLIFQRRDALKSKAINIIGEGQRYLSGFVKDANNTYWYFQYLQLINAGEGSGMSKTDGSKYSVVLEAQNDNYASVISEELVEELISNSTFFLVTEFGEPIVTENDDNIIYE